MMIIVELQKIFQKKFNGWTREARVTNPKNLQDWIIVHSRERKCYVIDAFFRLDSSNPLEKHVFWASQSTVIQVTIDSVITSFWGHR